MTRKELITSVWSQYTDMRDLMTRRGRRPAVNFVDRGIFSSNNSSSNYPDPKNYCPIEGRKLIYRSDIDNLFCCDCGWQPPKKRHEEEEQKQAQTQMGPKLKNEIGEGGRSNDDDIFCIPITKSRTQQLEYKMKQRRFPGYDSDLERIEKQGGVIIRSVEWLPLDDNRTYTYTTSSEESLRKRANDW